MHGTTWLKCVKCGSTKVHIGTFSERGESFMYCETCGTDYSISLDVAYMITTKLEDDAFYIVKLENENHRLKEEINALRGLA